jgi:hypothetical protein
MVMTGVSVGVRDGATVGVTSGREKLQAASSSAASARAKRAILAPMPK